MAHQTNLHTDDSTPVSLTRRPDGRHWLQVGEWYEEVAIFLDDAMLAKIHAATAPEVVIGPLTLLDAAKEADPAFWADHDAPIAELVNAHYWSNEDAAENDDWDIEPYPENEDAFWGYARD